MKKHTLLILILLLGFIPSFAQKNDKDKEARKKEMLEFKLNFLAEEMQLRDDQKKQFNEVYTMMENERRAVFGRLKAAEKKIKENKAASEADYERANKEIADAKNQMAAIETKYDAKFAKFLTKKQIYKMKEAEEKFMKKVRSCRDKKNKNPN